MCQLQLGPYKRINLQAGCSPNSQSSYAWLAHRSSSDILPSTVSWSLRISSPKLHVVCDWPAAPGARTSARASASSCGTGAPATGGAPRTSGRNPKGQQHQSSGHNLHHLRPPAGHHFHATHRGVKSIRPPPARPSHTRAPQLRGAGWRRTSCAARSELLVQH